MTEALRKATARSFEDDVRTVCRQLWTDAFSGGAENLEDRERDGVFRTLDTIHIVEATTSNKLQAAKDKLEKLASLCATLRRNDANSDKNFQVWLVLENEPTGDQGSLRTETKYRQKARCPIHVLSLNTLFSRLVDASDYARRRKNYAFGSVKPLGDGDGQKQDTYVPLDFVSQDGVLVNFEKLAEFLQNQSHRGAIFLGDFGSGKSMTLREIYLQKSRDFAIGKLRRFPIHLNLVDHFGQRSPAEAIIRHCDQIGFANANGIIGAWRAGFCDVILDGFDELYSTRFVLSGKNLRLAREDAVELVRRFVRETPFHADIHIAGRSSYFGSDISELEQALCTKGRFFITNIYDFNEAQVTRYLSNHKLDQKLPDWLPRRPLLLGYLIARRLVDKVELAQFYSVADGWDYLLDKIAERETLQTGSPVRDAHAVRRYLERLAWEARATADGRGPLGLEVLRRIFVEVFGREIDPQIELFIFRICGLTSSTSDPQAREFFDYDFADACSSANVTNYIGSPFENPAIPTLGGRHHLGELGVEMCARDLERRSVTSKQLMSVVEHAQKLKADGMLMIDLIQINQRFFGGKFPACSINGKDIAYLSVGSSIDLSAVFFEQCFFDILQIEEARDNDVFPQFRNCIINSVLGCSSRNQMPPGMISDDTEVLSFFDNYDTNAQILRSDLAIEIALLVTVLRKLFVQRGRARKEGAFFRGIELHHRGKVSSILRIVVKHDFATLLPTASGAIYVPNYSLAAEALNILSKPAESRHILAREVRDL